MKYFWKCLQLYADPTGRASRAEYWNFTLFYVLFAYALALTAMALRLPALVEFYPWIMYLPGLAVGMRRMHDTGRPGWYYWLPGLNLYLALSHSRLTPNEFEDAG